MTGSNRYLIIQLACFGDCLYATAIVRQLKHDEPNCHVTWAIASKYESAIVLNPFVDDRWVVSIDNGDYYNVNLLRIVEEAKRKKQAGEFTEIIVSQIPSLNWHRYDGTIRGTILASSPFPITQGVAPTLRLSDQEVISVTQVAEEWQLTKYKYVLLFECAPSSGQSFLNPDIALLIAEKVVCGRQDVCIILSSAQKINATSPHIKDGSVLSIRENAELANRCTHLIGCSSGITWACTSDWVSAPLLTIQLLSSSCKWYAGLEYDHKRWGLNADHIVEIYDGSIDQAVESILVMIDVGISECKRIYHQEFKPTSKHFEEAMRSLVDSGTGTRSRIISLIFNYLRANPHSSITEISAVLLNIFLRTSRVVRLLAKARNSLRLSILGKL